MLESESKRQTNKKEELEPGSKRQTNKKEALKPGRERHTNKIEDLWEEAGLLMPDTEGKERSLRAIRQEIDNKKFRYTPSLGELFVIEMQYISPFLWLVQGGLVAGLLFLVCCFGSKNDILAEDMLWASVVAAWMGVAACSNLGRDISEGMVELEQCCYFNLPQMWTMRMIITGIVDIALLMVCSGKIAEITLSPFGQVCVYLLVPFVLSNVCCLLLFSFIRGGKGRYGQLVMAFLTGVMAMFPSATPSLYRLEYLWIWMFVLLVGGALFWWQAQRLYGKIVRGELLCWN